jgi:hypothetical protein
VRGLKRDTAKKGMLCFLKPKQKIAKGYSFAVHLTGDTQKMAELMTAKYGSITVLNGLTEQEILNLI